MNAAEELLGACFAGDVEKARSALTREPAAANVRCEGIESPALVIAAHRGHMEIVRSLLEAGAAVDAREGASDTTALHWAAEAGHTEVARLLLDYGAQLDPVDGWYDLTPLGWACIVDWNPRFRENRPATIKLLLDRGARLDAFCAIALGRIEALASLDGARLSARLGVAAAHASALHFAILCANPSAVERLLELGSPLNESTADGVSPLGLALLERRSGIARRLFDAGAAEDLSARMAKDPPDASGASPSDDPLLHAMAARDRDRALSSLLDHGLDADYRMRVLLAAEEQICQITPLARAVSAGHRNAAAVLLSKGADANASVGKSALTPLHLAARTGKVEIAELLLSYGADASKRDLTFNATPAGFATHFHHPRLAELLRTL